jgi:photosystem II stability/assembly factor-like uncharacterized protein
MIKRYALRFLIFLLPLQVFAQIERITSFEKLGQIPSPINEIQFRNIGPTVMGGRVVDIEVNPNNANEFYVAYASGGLWHTDNNGQSLEPVFDHEATITIGDVAVNWNEKTIWVGTGEVNSSRSSYAGVGVYKSTDMGKTWKHKGLEESHHIGKIILHPKSNKIAWVAVLGHLYTTNAQRGIYKTIDGGETWNQTLFINDSTGCVDLQIDPNNSDVLYTCTWTRSRKAWQFNGVGSGTGIHKSVDGGVTWQLITTEKSGFPHGEKVGRIGISIFEKDSKIIYAVVDNNNNQPEKKEVQVSVQKLSARELQRMSKFDFLKLDEKQLNQYLKQNGYPKKYSAASLKKSVQLNEFTVTDIADWKLADADANLFDTPIYGAELYRSIDGGVSWNKTHEGDMGGVVFTYGYYFGTVEVSPTNSSTVLIAGYPLLLSEDGGKNFKQIDGENCHPDYHRIWINKSDDKHMIVGNDGGVNITYDKGQNWYKVNNPAVGQFYAIQVDNALPYNVYGGLQDNGTWMGPSTNSENSSWHQSGEYAYKNIGEGDGMQVQVDTRNNDTYYVGYQFGNYYKANKTNKDYLDVKPLHDIGAKPLRFNWQTPIWLSRHNQDIFYIGSNCLHRSLLQGEQLEKLSKDLTQCNRKGNVPYNTLTCIHESPIRFGLLYTGSDDGLIYVSQDGGYTMNLVSQGLPPGLWVSRISASKHKAQRVYASLNGYRNDDFAPYLYVSENMGATWKSIAGNLPAEPINVIKEDPKDESILYVGTDNGLYVSFDRGLHFVAWRGGLPRVAIHDIAIQERENEIVLGTHGRSIFIAKLDMVQAYNRVRNEKWHVFDIDKIKYNNNLGNKSYSYSKPQTEKVTMFFYTSEPGVYRFSVLKKDEQVLFTSSKQVQQGMNYIEYDLSINSGVENVDQKLIQKRDDGKYYLPVGNYQVEWSTTDLASEKGHSAIIYKTLEIVENRKE